MHHNFKRVAIVFAGGPAPAANAVISTAAVSFLRNDIEVIGVLYGYSNLVQFSADHPMREGQEYVILDHKRLKRTRNSQGIMIGSARTNPGKHITCKADLDDTEKSAPLKTVYDALTSMGVDALVSIGGDDTLKTANKFQMFQDRFPEGSKKIPVVHVPKTIDNDYMGIDFTFGYFTAVETLAGEIRNLLADAESTQSYFLAETMGRSAGWIAYGAAVAGEASLVVSVEDITGKYRQEEEIVDPDTKTTFTRPVMNVDETIKRVVATMRVREESEGKGYGVIVVAEGLAEFLPYKYVQNVPRDEHGHLSISHINLSELFSGLISAEYTRQTGRKRRIKGLQLGYESRCARPQAFDVMLGSQLGVGRLSSPGRGAAERGDGLCLGTARPALRPLLHAGRPGNAGDNRSLRAARFGLPSTGPIPGNVRERLRGRPRAGQVPADGGRYGTAAASRHDIPTAGKENKRANLSGRFARFSVPDCLTLKLVRRSASRTGPAAVASCGRELAGKGSQGLHVVRPLKGTRVGAVATTQAPLHLLYRTVLVLTQPSLDLFEQFFNVGWAVAQQGGRHLDDVGTGQQRFDHVIGKVHAAGSGNRDIGLVAQDGDPPQRQSQFMPAAQTPDSERPATSRDQYPAREIG